MLKQILKFFLDDTQEKYSFFRLYSNLSTWQKSGHIPYESELPHEISFEPSFWKRVNQIRVETKNDNHERAFSVFMADNELILTENVKGTTKSVSSNNTVSVRYIHGKKEGCLTREIYVDSSLYSSNEVYYKNVPKQISVSYLFNIHTHPEFKETKTYGYFSLVDINSFVNSKALVTGMIGEKFNLLMKSNKSPRALLNYEESEISKESLTNKCHFGVYEGEFQDNLKLFVSHLSNNKSTTSN
ncbi:hypothetical protein M0R04_03885 [Candidatus Dojkabacteria bacterium]|jgi:hypothetical protein|nr:hypothetical protein [Candidatus Dojkabacteria bacterium]